MIDSTDIRRLDKENRYLRRKLDRLETQRLRQEKIDEMNRFQAKRANSRLEVARAIAERSNRAKTEFLANMSHEIRTPLNIVLGMAELLAGTTLDSAQKHYLSSLRLSGEHLLKLIDNILEFSRIESGSVEIEPESFNLLHLLESLEEIGSHLARKKQIGFQLEIGDHLTAGRLGDMAKIKQILINLVTNAVKFTVKGQVTLAAAPLLENQKELVRFLVRDTGCGIPQEQQDLIFQRFSQVAGSRGEEKSGVGLGLAISQRLAMAMGGAIDFQSVAGQGTTFELILPLKAIPLLENDEQDRFPASDSQLEQMEAMSILAVDDVLLNLEIIKHFLAECPFRLLCANDGKEAVRAFADEHFDLILMDIRMPEMDGRRAARIIRRLERTHDGPGVPIIAMTAHAFAEQRKAFLADGFDEVLTKPFNKATLLRTLQSVTGTGPVAAVPTGNKALGALLEQPGHEQPLPPHLASLAPDFLNFLENSLATIDQAMHKRKYSELPAVCHAVKGVAGMYGFRHLAKLIENIEQSVGNRNPQAILSLTASLGAYLVQIKQEYQRLLRN